MTSPSFLSGFFWSGANACAAVVLPIAFCVFFARIVSPDVIGAVAVVIAFIEILKAMVLPGLYDAVLQQGDDRTRGHATASFVILTLTCILGVTYLAVLTVLSYLVEPVAAHYAAFATLSARLVLDAATLQPTARLAQQFAYRRLTIRLTTGIAVGGVIGVATGLLVGPLTGLVACHVCQSLVVLLMLVIGSGAAVLPKPQRDCFHRMHNEAVLSIGVRLPVAGANNLDQINLCALTGGHPAIRGGSSGNVRTLV